VVGICGVQLDLIAMQRLLGPRRGLDDDVEITWLGDLSECVCRARCCRDPVDVSTRVGVMVGRDAVVGDAVDRSLVSVARWRLIVGDGDGRRIFRVGIGCSGVSRDEVDCGLHGVLRADRCA
jgi:hypothetical protein